MNKWLERIILKFCQTFSPRKKMSKNNGCSGIPSIMDGKGKKNPDELVNFSTQDVRNVRESQESMKSHNKELSATIRSEDEPLLDKYREQITSTHVPCCFVVPKEDENLKLMNSKFGGKPFLPKNMEYPKDEDGQYMYLLAQINFSEMPKLSPFPNKGFLQIYISGFASFYGLNDNDPTNQKNFKVLYIEDESTTNLHDDFSFLPNFQHIPFARPFRIEFKHSKMSIPPSHYQFREIIRLDYEDEIEFLEEYGDQDCTHRIGGYASFIQEDPRSYMLDIQDKNILLLQINSDNKITSTNEYDILWSDVGIANFHISERDLLNKDFSKVMYWFDTH